MQLILDSFFTAAQRTQMCHALIEAPIFKGREDFRPFLIQARAEIATQALVAEIDVIIEMQVSLRSVS